jgi:uracil-DNA glycosylase
MFEAKARAELALANEAVPGAEAVRSEGDLFARSVLVKGTPGPGDTSEGLALAGADGAAARKALEALGLDSASTFATCSRPIDGAERDAVLLRLSLQIEAVDPEYVIALDDIAAADVAAALGLDQLESGHPRTAGGRTVLAVDGLEASLDDEARKARVWSQLKRLRD